MVLYFFICPHYKVFDSYAGAGDGCSDKLYRTIFYVLIGLRVLRLEERFVFRMKYIQYLAT